MSSEVPTDNDYVTRPSQKGGPVPVQSDQTPVKGATGDNAQDDLEAIDKSNITKDRLRADEGPMGGYREPGDKEGLPENDGRSAIAQ